MLFRWAKIGLGLAAAIALSQAQARFEPGKVKGPRVGPQNELLVLGTPHLSGLPASFDPAALDPLIARLSKWRPQAIAVEGLSGPQCDQLRRYPGRYRDTIEPYCWDPAPARAATGLDVPAATEAADQLLAHWPANPSPDQRRHLAAMLLAGGDRASALVQWLRLPVGERHEGDGLDAALVKLLEAYRVRRNETSLVAAVVAARVGLERLFQMDDHSADAAVADEKGYEAAITRAWTNPAAARRRALDEQQYKELSTGAAVLQLYRSANDSAAAPLVYRSDFGAALEEPSSQHFGRLYVGWWETRNLRMAANIRDMFALTPGIRGLVIVGASHKPYLDAYLDQMHDVRIVSTDAVLR